MQINLTEEQHKNLYVFLDRLEYKGFKEVQAINEIMVALNNPTEKQKEQAPKK